MANSFVRYTGNGSTTAYSIPFSYRSTADLAITLAGVASTAFTLNAAGTTLTFNTAPASNVAIEIRRRTSQGTKLVDYASGSVLTENDLDTDSDQAFFMGQEAIDDANDVIKISNTNFQWDATSKRITNVANPTSDQDVATKHYLENTWLSASDKTAIANLSSSISQINLLGTSDAVADMNTLATADVVADMNTLANSDIVSDLNTLASSDIVADMNTLATSANVTNMATLAGISGLSTLAANNTNITSLAGKTTELGLLGTSAVVADLALLGTSDVVADMALLATSDVISDMNTLATSDIISDLNTLASSGIVEDLNILATSANVTAMGLLGTSAVVTDLGLLGTSANVTNMATLGTSTNVSNMATLAGISSLSNLASAHAAVSTVATNLAAVQNFADVYRISSSAPTSSLTLGDLYFDTSANELKVYKSSGWAAAGSTVNGTSNRFEYTATANQTTFTGSDTNSKTLAYDAGFIDVYLNGVKLANADFTATSGTSVVLGTGASANDILMIVAYGTFQLANISINDLTNTPASIGTAGQALVVNSAGNALEYANASSAEVYGFNKYYIPSTLVKTVTVSSVGGSNKYFIDGVQQDTLDLYEGNTYIFNHPSAHPFRFSTDSNNSNAYTTGVTVNSTTQVTIVVASNAPTLYYYCSSHSGMGGTANTPIPANNAVQYITTNQGQDNITESQYANFDDVLFSASGFVFSINSNGNLISTI
ncbi:phage tail fiber protein [Candidatus Pelagibacter sp.]|nr:phage tail fiber protein [Candidatus Pelagibacter sp.]